MSRILLIGMDFYKYESAMVRILERQHDVTLFIDKKDFPLDHFHIPINKEFRQRMISKYQEEFLVRSKHDRYDYVLVLVGRYLTASFLAELRNRNPEARFILYLWDDVKRVANFNIVKHFYDSIITFDPGDAAIYGFGFMPLMYINRVENICDTENDVYSTMYLHSDREVIVERLIEKHPDLRWNVNFKCPLFVSIRKEINKQSKSIHYSRFDIKYEDIVKGMLASRAILDVQFSSQIGLTMRTFDVMAVGHKLITTNESIKYYDFYNASNIAIISRNDPLIPDGFLQIPYEPIPEEILNKYSMESWLDNLLESTNRSYMIVGNPYGLE